MLAPHVAANEPKSSSMNADMLSPSGMYRQRYVRVMVYLAQIAADLIAIPTSFAIAAPIMTQEGLRAEDGLLALMTSAIFILVSFYARTYSFMAMQSVHVAVTRAIHAWLVTLGLVLLIVFTRKQGDEFSRAVFLAAGVGAAFIMVFTRVILVKWVRSRLRSSSCANCSSKTVFR